MKTDMNSESSQLHQLHWLQYNDNKTKNISANNSWAPAHCWHFAW